MIDGFPWWVVLLTGCGVFLASFMDAIAALNPCSYRRYDYDEETGYYYLQSRYYDPEIGRFVSSDEIEYLGVAQTICGYNLFSYCYNNPIVTEDATGHFGTPIQWAFAAVGAIVGVSLGSWLARQFGYASSSWGSIGQSVQEQLLVVQFWGGFLHRF